MKVVAHSKDLFYEHCITIHTLGHTIILQRSKIMEYPLYSSSEMFSATHLIRQSKIIFDKLQEREIEKAVILRDGKPSFVMLDFELYESLMKEHYKLQNKNKKDKSSIDKNRKVSEPQATFKNLNDQQIIQTNIQPTIQIEERLLSVEKAKEDVFFNLDGEHHSQEDAQIKEFWDK